VSGGLHVVDAIASAVAAAFFAGVSVGLFVAALLRDRER
jgi:hypothetical protein